MNNFMVKLVLFFTLALLVLIGLMHFLPGAYEPLAVQHPTIDTILKSSGDRTHPKFLLVGFLMGFLFISIMASCVILGYLKRGALGRLAPWLIGGFVVYQLIFLALVLSYAGYQPGPESAFFLGFPNPTAWMIYGIWMFPFCFILFFMKNFDSWFVTREDLDRFNQLLKNRDAGKDGA